ncbi:MAG: type II secretion system minor pseudopilin GspK [Pseudohongiellaceae bacterium]
MKLNACSLFQASESGGALVLAMLVVALVSTLAVRFSGQYVLAATRIENQLLVSRYHHYLEGAESLAAVVLSEDVLTGEVDHSGEFWASPLPPLAVAHGRLQMQLSDAQGKLNLNSLAASTQWINDSGAMPMIRFTALQRHFIRLLQTFEDYPLSEYEAIQITEAVIDWLDGDQTPTGSGGAEAVYYGSGQPAYEPPDGLFTSVSELALLRHVTPELYQRLLPYVVVLPQATALNVNTMDAVLLRTFNDPASLQPLEPMAVQALQQTRQQRPFLALADFFAHDLIAGFELFRLPEVGVSYSVGSSYFFLQSSISDEALTTSARSLLFRHEHEVSIIQRRFGLL